MHAIMWILRALLRIPQPQVKEEEALNAAIAEANARSIPAPNVRVVECLRVWEVWLNHDAKGSPVIVVDHNDGSIKEVRELPR